MANQSPELRVWRGEVSPGLYDVNAIVCISIRERQGVEETHRGEGNKKSGKKQTKKCRPNQAMSAATKTWKRQRTNSS